jgi:uncharacterized membrane protein YgcG
VVEQPGDLTEQLPDDVGPLWRTGPIWKLVLVALVLGVFLWATCVPMIRGGRVVGWLRLPVPVLLFSWTAFPCFGDQRAPWLVGAFAAALVLARLISRHEEDDDLARAPGLVGQLGILVYLLFTYLALFVGGAVFNAALGSLLGGLGGRGGGASWGGGGGRFSGGGASGKW